MHKNQSAVSYRIKLGTLLLTDHDFVVRPLSIMVNAGD